MNTELLQEKAKLIRSHAVESTYCAHCGHPGGSLSCADILSYLYFHKMNHDPKNPDKKDRDRFVLSKGHAAPALYAALAEAGYFPVEELKTLRKLGSRLQGHPDKLKTPGVEASTGSLGQGLSIAVGMALASKLDKASWKVFSILGDGESQEGQVWEASMAAAHYKCDNLIAFTDNNRLQIDGEVKDVMNVQPLTDKWKAFGWHVIEINGHDFAQIDAAVTEAEKQSIPTMIIAKTVKGKGVSFMENQVSFHGKACDEEQCKIAMEELK